MGITDDPNFTKHFLGYFKLDYGEVKMIINSTTKVLNGDFGSETKCVELPIESIDLFKVLIVLIDV